MGAEDTRSALARRRSILFLSDLTRAGTKDWAAGSAGVGKCEGVNQLGGVAPLSRPAEAAKGQLSNRSA